MDLKIMVVRIMVALRPEVMVAPVLKVTARPAVGIL
jgi:hypothetical protein